MTVDFNRQFRIRPGSRVNLVERDPDETCGFDKDQAKSILADARDKLCDLQQLLYAENRRSLLVVLQAMDTGGKDGVIRDVMTGMNPAGVAVTSFKAPTPEELDHDFLWRIHRALPGKGEIGVFNRSHYEDVVAVRVRKLAPAAKWRARYEQINQFERLLSSNDVVILKFFLHISKSEQRERLQARLEDPSKRWKFSLGDLEERKRWSQYQQAYQEAIRRCSTKHAPWFVIPANRKWFRNLAVAQIMVETLEGLNMKYPKPGFDAAKVKVE